MLVSRVPSASGSMVISPMRTSRTPQSCLGPHWLEAPGGGEFPWVGTSCSRLMHLSRSGRAEGAETCHNRQQMAQHCHVPTLIGQRDDPRAQHRGACAFKLRPILEFPRDLILLLKSSWPWFPLLLDHEHGGGSPPPAGEPRDPEAKCHPTPHPIPPNLWVRKAG